MDHCSTAPEPVRDLLTEIAETASAGVTHHLRRRERAVALPMQSFAAAAWGAAQGAVDVEGVREEARRALRALTAVQDAGMPRRFLAAVLRRLDEVAPPATAAPPAFASLPELASLLDGCGVVSVRAAQLRDALGARRLDAPTGERLVRALEALGIGTTPADLPNRGDAWVRLHRRGHPLGLLVTAAGVPGPAGDRILRHAALVLQEEGRP